MDDEKLVAGAVGRGQRRADARERRMLVRSFRDFVVDTLIKALAALRDFPGRALVDADVPPAEMEHQLRQRRQRQPAGDFRAIGTHVGVARVSDVATIAGGIR